jgi:hypothetical protein
MSDDLQFDEAEYDAPPEMPTTCAACSQSLGEAFWVEDRRFALCDGCKSTREAAASGFSAMAMAKGLVFGLVGAVVGGFGWGVITAITGFNIGLIAIVAGAIVAFGITLGAGRGGILFQMMAAVLTYFAICFNDAVIYAYFAFTEEGMGVLGSLVVLVLATPYLLVMLIPDTIANGGFISILIYGFAIWQAIQMTAGEAPVYEGPFATNG